MGREVGEFRVSFFLLPVLIAGPIASTAYRITALGIVNIVAEPVPS